MGGGLNLSNFKAGNLRVTFVIALALIAFIFLPDLIGYEGRFRLDQVKDNLPFVGSSKENEKAIEQESTVGSIKEIPAEQTVQNDEVVVPGSQPEVRSVAVHQAPGEPSPLADLSQRVSEGYIDELAAAPAEDEPIKSGSVQKDPGVEAVTWEELKSPKITDLIVQSKNKALLFANKLEQGSHNSRYAIFNYATGLDRVLNRNIESVMSAQEAVGYIEYLNRQVIESLSKDKLKPEKNAQWVDISLTPIIGSKQAGEKEKKKEQEPPPEFKPNIRLFYTILAQPYKKKKQFDPGKSAHLSFGLFVFGEGIKQAQLISNGKTKKLSLNSLDSNNNRFRTDIKKLDARRIITIVLKDKHGSVYKKSYLFKRALRDFDWHLGKNGKFYYPSIPFNLGYRDSDLDTFFTLRTYRDNNYYAFKNRPDWSYVAF
jgi:hypothetical protein